jgi:hypothetical protein
LLVKNGVVLPNKEKPNSPLQKEKNNKNTCSFTHSFIKTSCYSSIKDERSV